MNTCITAVQHLPPLRGGAQAHLLQASDGNCYVTKFQNNPQHIKVLANEMLAGRLGWLSLCNRVAQTSGWVPRSARNQRRPMRSHWWQPSSGQRLNANREWPASVHTHLRRI